MTKEKDYNVELTIGGEDIPMLPFIEAILKDVTLGVVSNLKGYEEGKEIIIKIK